MCVKCVSPVCVCVCSLKNEEEESLFRRETISCFVFPPKRERPGSVCTVGVVHVKEGKKGGTKMAREKMKNSWPVLSLTVRVIEPVDSLFCLLLQQRAADNNKKELSQKGWNS